MRMTQYIGLNDYAKKLVANAIRVETNPAMTEGMFEEKVPGKIYVCSADGANVETIYEEVCQDAPWSSGPMIFTCLKVTLVKKSGQKLDMGNVCEWIVDPGVREEHGEYDEKTGRYYV